MRLFVIIVLAAGPAFADDVYLRGGGQITGQIIAETEDTVTVDIGGGTITAKKSSVVKIEKNTSPLQEYRTRAANIPTGDAEAWRELARWAKGYSLSSQARQAYREVLKILPDENRVVVGDVEALDRPALAGTAGRLAWHGDRRLLPADYLVRRDGRLGVFTIEDNRARFVTVPQAQEGRPAAVDLPPGTRLISDGRQGLSDGQEVNLIPPREQP